MIFMIFMANFGIKNPGHLHKKAAGRQEGGLMKGRAPKAKGEDEREVSKVPRPHNGDFPWGFRDFQWGFSNKNADFPDVILGFFSTVLISWGIQLKDVSWMRMRWSRNLTGATDPSKNHWGGLKIAEKLMEIHLESSYDTHFKLNMEPQGRAMDSYPFQLLLRNDTIWLFNIAMERSTHFQ